MMLKKHGHFNEYIFSENDLRDYKEYCKIIENIKITFSLTDYSVKEIDKYLWQLGKFVFKETDVTARQEELIQKYLTGKYNPESISEQMEFSAIVNKAEELEILLHAYDEAGDDLIKWYYNKIKNNYV